VAATHAQAFLPALAAGPSGVLGLLFYDTRNDVSGDGKLTTDLWFAESTDRGDSWEQTHVVGSFDALTAPNFFNQGHLLGDSIDLTSAPGGFDAVFTLAQPLARSGPINVFFSHIELGAPPPASAGAALVTVPTRRPCTSRRRLSIHLHAHRGERVTSIVVMIDHRTVASRHPRHGIARIDLRGLPRGSFTIRVSARTNRARTIRLTRRYRTCTPHKA
jgi:hypothetical protein